MRPILCSVLALVVLISPARAAGYVSPNGVGKEILILSPGSHQLQVKSPELIQCYLAREGQVLDQTDTPAHACSLHALVPSGGGTYLLTVIHVNAADHLPAMTPMSYTLVRH